MARPTKVLLPALALALPVACKPKEKVVTQTVEVPVEKIVYVDKQPEGGGTTATPTGTDTGTATATGGIVPQTDVTIAGALALSTEPAGAGLSLLDDGTTPYALNCVTFADEPAAFKVDVVKDAAGAMTYEGQLKDVAGVAFGCFLLKDGVPLAPIVFGTEASLVTGGGRIEAGITYNEKTKSAAAIIDLAKSTAMAEDAVTAAKKARGGADDKLPSLTGTYKIDCDANNGQGFTCDSGNGFSKVPSKLYLSEFAVQGKAKVALWDDKAAHDRCVPPSNTNASDAEPAFGLRLGSLLLAMDFDSESALNSSLDAAYQTLKSDSHASYRALADAIVQQAKDRSDWKVQLCDNNAFSNTNCKLLLADTDSYTYTDYATGKDVTYTYTRWVDETAFANASSYAGAVKTSYVACATFWTPDKDICPKGTPVDEKGYGTYQAFYGSDGTMDKRLRLVCKDPNGNWTRYQENATASTLDDAITAASAANGCTSVTSGPFTGKHEVFRDAVRSGFSEMTASAVGFGADLCRHAQLPTTFTFADCAAVNTQQLNFMYWEPVKPEWITADMEKQAKDQGFTYQYYHAADRSVLETCRWVKDWNSNWLEIGAGGKLQRVAGNTMQIDTWRGRSLCPVAFAANPDGGGTYSTDCEAEFFTNATVAQQAEAVMRDRIGVWDALRYAVCPTMSQAARDDFASGIRNTCLPQARIVFMCDNSGNCSSNLRCDGTKGGKCADDFGTFIGRISGRVGVMDLKLTAGLAFDLSSTLSDKWVAWDQKENKMKACTIVSDTIVNGKGKTDGSSFDAYYKQRVKQDCSAIEGAQAMAESGGSTNNGSTQDPKNGNGGGQQQQTTTETTPEQDILRKLKFTKCANDTCT